MRVSAQSASLEKKWTTDTTLRVPESVYFDAKSNVLFVANIDGQPWANDGQGFISKMSPDGKITSLHWVDGLNSPKGMGIHGNRLYVADMSQVVEIDIAKGAIVTRHAIPDALNLNDLSVDPKGTVYVTDSKRKKVHTLINGKSAVLLDSATNGLKGPNGVLYRADGLLVLDAGAVFRAGKDGKLTKLADVTRGTDGIEHVQGDEYIVSCWQGEVFYVNIKTGTATKVLDTQANKLQSADIGYDAKKKIVYVPTFFGNNVSAYQLNVTK
ncbi:ATP/GTP-binding protein [Chitinophaga barathri]|uniref:ATP/GTP-binding protein n=2 Tax=Chitinophaga barathri TaxID=1647451 RepID=A0A3N4MAA7_9BACT|nr:ATP/GTP-binding protein [Chitinophaga barathri]